jgi:hypothetical protein
MQIRPYYRMRSASHNVLMIDDRDQELSGKAKFLKFGTAASPCAVVDLTSAYAPMAARATRGIALVQDRCAVLVQDEVELPEAHDIVWGMTTDAEIKLARSEALLTQDGKELRARILSPAGARFAEESAEQPPPQKANKGVRRLVVRLDKRIGAVRIAILLSPSWKDGAAPGVPALTDLGQW